MRTVQVNGTWIDASDRRIPPDFPGLATEVLAAYAEKHGKAEGLGASDLTVRNLGGGANAWRIVRRSDGIPVDDPKDSVFRTDDLLKADAARKEAMTNAIAQNIDERLTPLFVIPGTTLGLSRPSGRGYTPAEMAKINSNIDAEAAKSTFNPLAGIRERAAEMDAADAARETAEAEERKQPRKSLKEKMGIQIPKRRGWRDGEQKKDAE